VPVEVRVSLEVYHSTGKPLKGSGKYEKLVSHLDRRNGYFYMKREKEVYTLVMHTQASFSEKKGRYERIYMACRTQASSSAAAVGIFLRALKTIEGEETEWGQVVKIRHPGEIEELLDTMRRAEYLDKRKAGKYRSAVEEALNREEAATFEANIEEGLTLALTICDSIDGAEAVLHFKNYSPYDIFTKYVGIFITGSPLTPVGEFRELVRRKEREVLREEMLGLLSKMEENLEGVWKILNRHPELKYDEGVRRRMSRISQRLSRLVPTIAPAARHRYRRYGTTMEGDVTFRMERSRKRDLLENVERLGMAPIEVAEKALAAVRRYLLLIIVFLALLGIIFISIYIVELVFDKKLLFTPGINVVTPKDGAELWKSPVLELKPEPLAEYTVTLLYNESGLSPKWENKWRIYPLSGLTPEKICGKNFTLLIEAKRFELRNNKTVSFSVMKVPKAPMAKTLNGKVFVQNSRITLEWNYDPNFKGIYFVKIYSFKGEVIHTGNTSKTSYVLQQDLPPGNYTWEVRAAGEDGICASPPASRKFVVR